jgi:hypothetical protein
MGFKSKFTATFRANLPRGSPLTIPHAKTPLLQLDFMLTVHLENEIRSRSSRIGGSPAKAESRKERNRQLKNDLEAAGS